MGEAKDIPIPAKVEARLWKKGSASAENRGELKRLTAWTTWPPNHHHPPRPEEGT